MKRIISSVVGIGVLAMTVAASAQTLADLAKKDTDRRKTVKHPAKVYTNDDVQDVKPILPMMENDGTGTRPVDPAAGGNADSEGGSNRGGGPVATPAKPDAAKPGAAKAGDEAAWRARLSSAKEAISRTQLQLESMRSRAGQLTAASAAANDQNRATFQKQQQDALQEYDKLRGDLERNQKALADLQSEATKANVPPGWLR